LLARRVSLQKSVGDAWSRISSATALQKGRSGSSEQGPSSSLSSADDTVVACLARNNESQVGLSRQERMRTGIRPRVTRDRHPAVSPSRERCGGRGTGVVMATGSYEGSLSAEGILDQHEASAFTSRRRRWSRCSAPSFDPYETFERRTYGQTMQRPRKWMRRRVNEQGTTRVPEAQSPSAPWEENAHAVFSAQKAGRQIQRRMDGSPKRS
jgi:hypothetical protein